MRATQNRTEHLGSVNKTLDVLEAFSLAAPDRSLSELSAELGIAKPTLHRILANLQARGYVRQDPDTRRYRLGVKTWEIGVVGIGGFSLRETARMWLTRLSEETGEQATLWVYDDGDVVCIDRSEATHRVRSYTHLGTREPAHLLSVGRVLLTFREPEEINRVISGLEDGEAEYVSQRLEWVREQGYDFSPGDRWPDVYAVGAPVLDHSGEVIAAIGVSGPSTRFDDDLVAVIATPLKRAAAECSRQLGYAAVPAAS